MKQIILQAVVIEQLSDWASIGTADDAVTDGKLQYFLCDNIDLMMEPVGTKLEITIKVIE